MSMIKGRSRSRSRVIRKRMQEQKQEQWPDSPNRPKACLLLARQDKVGTSFLASEKVF